jgi:hypothetical protein
MSTLLKTDKQILCEFCSKVRHCHLITTLIVNILMHALRKKLSSETRSGDAFTDGRLRSGKVRRTYIREGVPDTGEVKKETNIFMARLSLRKTGDVLICH